MGFSSFGKNLLDNRYSNKMCHFLHSVIPCTSFFGVKKCQGLSDDHFVLLVFSLTGQNFFLITRERKRERENERKREQEDMETMRSNPLVTTISSPSSPKNSSFFISLTQWEEGDYSAEFPSISRVPPPDWGGNFSQTTKIE